MGEGHSVQRNQVHPFHVHFITEGRTTRCVWLVSKQTRREGSGACVLPGTPSATLLQCATATVDAASPARCPHPPALRWGLGRQVRLCWGTEPRTCCSRSIGTVLQTAPQVAMGGWPQSCPQSFPAEGTPVLPCHRQESQDPCNGGAPRPVTTWLVECRTWVRIWVFRVFVLGPSPCSGHQPPLREATASVTSSHDLEGYSLLCPPISTPLIGQGILSFLGGGGSGRGGGGALSLPSLLTA